MPLTLRGRVVLPMHGPALDGGWVRIVGSRIIAVGRRRPDGPVIDLGDSILLPGLVNPHCHLEFSSISTPLPPEPPGGLAGWIPAVMQARFAETSNPAAAIAAGLPGYRLSKFQPLMPPWVEREVISRYLLDGPGTWQWLSEPGH